MRAGFDTSSAPAQAIFLLHAELVGASRAFAIRKLLIAAACDTCILQVSQAEIYKEEKSILYVIVVKYQAFYRVERFHFVHSLMRESLAR
jgi:hypothetical protein